MPGRRASAGPSAPRPANPRRRTSLPACARSRDRSATPRRQGRTGKPPHQRSQPGCARSSGPTAKPGRPMAAPGRPGCARSRGRTVRSGRPRTARGRRACPRRSAKRARPAKACVRPTAMTARRASRSGAPRGGSPAPRRARAFRPASTSRAAGRVPAASGLPPPAPDRACRAPRRRPGAPVAGAFDDAGAARALEAAAGEEAGELLLLGRLGHLLGLGHRHQVSARGLLVAEHPLGGEVAHVRGAQSGRSKPVSAAAGARRRGAAARRGRRRTAPARRAARAGAAARRARRCAPAASRRRGAWAGATPRPRAPAHGRRSARRCAVRPRAGPSGPGGAVRSSRVECRRP